MYILNLFGKTTNITLRVNYNRTMRKFSVLNRDDLDCYDNVNISGRDVRVPP